MSYPKRGTRSPRLRWETHCHTLYSSHRQRWFDALNSPREMIEAAIRKGLDGIIITDHDNVKGGLVGKKVARAYPGFTVIPGTEITSLGGHILAIGVESNIPKRLPVADTVDRIHDLGGIAVASHPFSSRVRPSLESDCLKTDGVEVFNAMNRGTENAAALSLAMTYTRPMTAGSDAHWEKMVGTAGIICDDPMSDVARGRTRLFGGYSTMMCIRAFQFRQFASALVNRPLWR